MKNSDLHWLAGIMEGEGSFMKPYTKKNTGQPRISFVSTDKDTTQRVADLLGTSYYQRIPTSKDGHTRKPQYVFTLVSSRCIGIMNELYPLMGQRRRGQIEEALSAVPKLWDNPCKLCKGDIQRVSSHRGMRPVYCSKECAKRSRSIQQRERQQANREYVNENKRNWRAKRKAEGYVVT